MISLESKECSILDSSDRGFQLCRCWLGTHPRYDQEGSDLRERGTGCFGMTFVEVDTEFCLPTLTYKNCNKARAAL